MAEAREQTNPLETLHGVTRRLIHAKTPTQIADLCVQAARDELGYSLASVWYVDDDNSSLVLSSNTSTHQNHIDEQDGGSLRHPEGSWVWDILENSQAEAVESISSEKLAADIPLESVLLIPLGDHGLLSLGSAEETQFDPTVRNYAEILAKNASAALDQLKQERELGRLKKQYETVFNHSQDALFLLEQTREDRVEFIRFNPKEEQLTGMTTEEVSGKSPVEAFGEELGREVESNYWRCLKAGEPISYEENLDFPAGKTCYFHTKLAPVDVDEETTQIVGVARDITERKQMQERIKRENRRLETVIETREDILESGLQVEEIIGIALDKTRRVTDADAGVYDATAESDRPDLTLWTRRGEDSQRALEPVLRGVCLEEDRVVNVGDLQEDDRVDLPDDPDFPFQSALGIPISHDRTTYGVLEVFARKPYRFGKEHQRTLSLMAGLLAGSLFNADQFREIKDLLDQTRTLARRDSLTDLSNRKHLFEKLEEEIERASRYGRTFSFAVLDLDHFKRVNDRFGHQAGDRVLQRVARLLENGVRDADHVGRYGGEEFGILFPEINRNEAFEVCERVRESIQAATFELNGDEELTITCSLGVAEWRSEIDGLNELVGRADRALYKAKRKGRNRVITAQSID